MSWSSVPDSGGNKVLVTRRGEQREAYGESAGYRGLGGGQGATGQGVGIRVKRNESCKAPECHRRGRLEPVRARQGGHCNRTSRLGHWVQLDMGAWCAGT